MPFFGIPRRWSAKTMAYIFGFTILWFVLSLTMNMSGKKYNYDREMRLRQKSRSFLRVDPSMTLMENVNGGKRRGPKRLGRFYYKAHDAHGKRESDGAPDPLSDIMTATKGKNLEILSAIESNRNTEDRGDKVKVKRNMKTIFGNKLRRRTTLSGVASGRDTDKANIHTRSKGQIRSNGVLGRDKDNNADITKKKAILNKIDFNNGQIRNRRLDKSAIHKVTGNKKAESDDIIGRDGISNVEIAVQGEPKPQNDNQHDLELKLKRD